MAEKRTSPKLSRALWLAGAWLLPPVFMLTLSFRDESIRSLEQLLNAGYFLLLTSAGPFLMFWNIEMQSQRIYAHWLPWTVVAVAFTPLLIMVGMRLSRPKKLRLFWPLVPSTLLASAVWYYFGLHSLFWGL